MQPDLSGTVVADAPDGPVLYRTERKTVHFYYARCFAVAAGPLESVAFTAEEMEEFVRGDL